MWARRFPNFVANELSKVDKILRLTFFRQENTLKDWKRSFSIYCSWIFLLGKCLQLPFIRLEEAVLWTNRFLTRRNISSKNEVHLWQTKRKANVCRSSTFQVNGTKNATGKRRLTSSNRATMSALHRKNDTTNLFGYKLGELTEINKALLFFSGNFFNSISSTWELPCLKILQRSNFGTNFERMIWFVSQLVLFNGFVSDFVGITSCVYTKTIILFNLREEWL